MKNILREIPETEVHPVDRKAHDEATQETNGFLLAIERVTSFPVVLWPILVLLSLLAIGLCMGHNNREVDRQLQRITQDGVR